MASRTDVEATGTIDGVHACRSCDARTLARVAARSIASTQSSGSLFVARAEARAGLVRDARDSLAIVACPACARRDRQAMLRPLATLGALAALAFGLIGGMGGFLAFAALGIGVVADRFQLDVIAPPLIGWTLVVASAAAWAMIRARIRRADRAVQFQELEAEPREPGAGPYRRKRRRRP